MSAEIIVHVIHEKTGQMLSRRYLVACPRAGEEIRLNDGIYYTVKRVIWCLDEISPLGQRVNIGVERAS